MTEIPRWKWFLLHFVKTYKGFDTEGSVTMVCHIKLLFKHMYVWKYETYDNHTGNLLRVNKLTRKG